MSETDSEVESDLITFWEYKDVTKVRTRRHQILVEVTWRFLPVYKKEKIVLHFGYLYETGYSVFDNYYSMLISTLFIHT